jgi:hypothetical protein
MEVVATAAKHMPKKEYIMNWLQVSASTKLSEVDKRESNEFEAKMTNLFSLKAH